MSNAPLTPDEIKTLLPLVRQISQWEVEVLNSEPSAEGASALEGRAADILGLHGEVIRKALLHCARPSGETCEGHAQALLREMLIASEADDICICVEVHEGMPSNNKWRQKLVDAWRPQPPEATQRLEPSQSCGFCNLPILHGEETQPMHGLGGIGLAHLLRIDCITRSRAEAVEEYKETRGR